MGAGCRKSASRNFYPRPPRGGRPGADKPADGRRIRISIHALREEGDFSARRAGRYWMHFYPRPPRGGRLISLSIVMAAEIFLSTPSARRATCHPASFLRLWEISIHALREEGDCRKWSTTSSRQNFYPRPPRGGRPVLCRWAGLVQNFYPRPPRGGRRVNERWLRTGDGISIHALREEGDTMQHKAGNRCSVFLSTPSARRATAPFMRGLTLIQGFLSTPSARRATLSSSPSSSAGVHFYPRPPRGGRRDLLQASESKHLYFYPRPPRGGRRQCA